jgi:5-methyltetrahydropteroyltriglutamate--homocysteine methyltransferase
MKHNAPLKYLRVDQIGSLVPDARWRSAVERYKRGEFSVEELREVQNRAVDAVIAKQELIGLPVVTDGELRRLNFQESFAASVTGFDVPAAARMDYRPSTELRPLQRAEQDFEAVGPALHTRRPVAERLKLARNLPLEEYRYASRIATRPVKATVLSADRISQRFAYERSTAVYKDMDAFLADVVAINRQIIASLVDAGCRYIQVDAPGYTAYVDQISLDRMRARGEDPDVNLQRSIAADNAMIDGFDNVTFGIHVCRGNPRTVDPATGTIVPQWHREGHYDAIAERLFNGLRYHRLLLEYDSERAGSFAPLRFVPRDKVAVLGLVTTKLATVEPTDELRRRIDQASAYLPLEQLALSPQCGFGRGVTLSQDDQWRKFERIMETASLVWGERSGRNAEGSGPLAQ